ncbi:LysR family transcriptional regulator [Pseudomonas sp. Fl5BN2]|uniref:LysR family transcriptional regulator n=1 Tax=unclassified Pseudomonas TaxID=196821 RepID=UPI00137778D7|nr:MULTISPECIES: LysR family transcriptional regulator [unclassified Pseudomonas]NBF06776.1 LysR family transcriptional regulator [Pseudomonas sp. Fl5BN2]NBF12827.1 LysR family transcriptional regulator [Pseudomonas sp. Fl4BN1]
MAISFRQLQIFCAVARTGSTTTAAESISLSQSATSAAVNELEAQLGSRLFERVGKRLHLNEVGRALLPQALRLLDDVHQLQQQFGSAASMPAHLAVAASSTIGNYVLPRLLASFQQANPNTQVNITIANTSTAIEQVQGFEADAGLIEGPCRASHLLVEPWLEDDLVLVAAPLHPLASQGRVSLEALRQTRWLLREDGSGTREEVNHLLLPHLHYLPDTLVMGGSEAIKHSVAAGLGISCLSRWVVEEQLGSGSLIALSSDLPRLTRHFYLLRHRDKFVSPALERFWNCCQSFSSPRALP